MQKKLGIFQTDVIHVHPTSRNDTKNIIQLERPSSYETGIDIFPNISAITCNK